MQIDIHQTVTPVDSRQVAADDGVLIVILTLVADESTGTTGVQMTNDGILITRPNSEVKDEDRVFLSGLDGVHIASFRPDIFAAPKEGVAFTD